MLIIARNSIDLFVRFLAGEGCIKPLCDLLVCPNPRTILVCLDGLENILKVGEGEKIQGNTGNVNIFAQMIDDVEGLEKMETLQNHDNNEVYEKVVKILETYWSDDGDGEHLQKVSEFNFGGGQLPVPSDGFKFSEGT